MEGFFREPIVWMISIVGYGTDDGGQDFLGWYESI